MSKPSRVCRPEILLVSLLLLVAAPVGASHHEGAGAPPPADASSGTVLETMDAGGYTYLRVQTEGGEVWAAGPPTAVSLGDRVALDGGVPMADFRSETLGRTFASIRFVGAIRVLSRADGSAPDATLAGMHGAVQEAGAASVDPLPRAEGGLTVAELYARKDEVVGSTVVVRGRVVKFNGGILDRNWIHIRDGSGEAGSNDLTVTTDGKAAVGDVVLVRGKVVADRDFGMGYRYDLLIEDAEVKVE